MTSKTPLSTPRPAVKHGTPSLFKMPSVSRAAFKPLWHGATTKLQQPPSVHSVMVNDENRPPASPDKSGFVQGFLRTVSGASSTKSANDTKSGKADNEPEREALKVSVLVSGLHVF